MAPDSDSDLAAYSLSFDDLQVNAVLCPASEKRRAHSMPNSVFPVPAPPSMRTRRWSESISIVRAWSPKSSAMSSPIRSSSSTSRRILSKSRRRTPRTRSSFPSGRRRPSRGFVLALAAERSSTRLKDSGVLTSTGPAHSQLPHSGSVGISWSGVTTKAISFMNSSTWSLRFFRKANMAP